MKIIQCFMVFIWLFISPAWAVADSATASLDRSITSLGESVLLQIHVVGSANESPDFSVLQEDFEVLNQSQSSNYRLINGSLSRSKVWSVNLMPKRQGKIQIPAISLGNMSTKPLLLQVVAAQQRLGVQGKDIYLELTVNSQHSYVQAQVVLTVKLFRGINLSQAQLTEPEMPHVIIKKMGADKTYETLREHRRFVVTERRYAMFPEQSGKLHVPALQFTGQEVSRMGMFNQAGRILRVKSNTLDIMVDSMPNTWPQIQPWLPAEDVSIREIPMDNQSEPLKVGEPLTRTIEIRAKGLTAEQIPQFIKPADKGDFKQYPDKPVLRTDMDENGVIGIRREKVAMIPTKSGDLVLPAISILWWNSKTKALQKTGLLERIIHVEKSAKANIQPLKTLPTVAPKNKPTPTTELQVIKPMKQANIGLWQGLTIFFAAAWLLSMALWWYFSSAKKKNAEKQTEITETHVDLKKCRKELERACQSGQAKEVVRLLPQWAARFFQDKNMTTMVQLKGQSEALDAAILVLEMSLYGQQSEQIWDGNAMLQAISELRIPEKESPISGLKPLA